MQFREYGKSDADTIILLHGAGLSWWNFRAEAELLSEHYHVILPILDGHDGSDRPFISIKAEAEELLGLIDECCGGSVLAIAGLSLGAQVLLELVSRRKGIAEFLIFESALAIPMRLIAALVPPSVAISHPLVKHRGFARLQAKSLGIPPAFFEEYFQASSRIDKASLSDMLRENALFMPETAIDGIKALVLVGSRERGIMLRSARKLHAMMACSKLIILEGYRHGELSLCHPEEYVDILTGFVEGRL